MEILDSSLGTLASENFSQKKLEERSRLVFNNAKTLKENGAESAVLIFEYGNKRLELRYNPTFEEYWDYIENKSKNKEKKISNETTIIYMAVRKKLEELSDLKKIPIKYVLMTTNEEIHQWAETKGDEIFRWLEKTKKSWMMAICIMRIDQQ